jgi:hypothetical protein
MNNSDKHESMAADPLGDEEPPVENIETFYPGQDDELPETQEDEKKQLPPSSENKANVQSTLIEVQSEQNQEMDRLRAENEELKVRNNLLKKSLYGIVEAIASL